MAYFDSWIIATIFSSLDFPESDDSKAILGLKLKYTTVYIKVRRSS